MTNRKTIGGLATAAWLAALAAPALAAPGNDDFEHAQVLGPAPVTVAGSLAGATVQPGDPTSQRADVWYSFTAAATGPYAVELPTRDGHVDYAPSVYTGADRAHLLPVPSQDHSRWYGRTRFAAVAGQTYRILVTGWEPKGRFTINVHQAVPPAGDDITDALNVRVPGLYHGTLEDATTELGERVPYDRKGTVWYRIRPKHSSRLTVDASDAACLPVVGAFTGDQVSELHRITEKLNTIRFYAKRHHTYKLRLACTSGYVGDYTLDISDGSIAGKGVHMAIKPGQTVGSVRRHGLRLDVGARRKVEVKIELLVGRHTQRRLHLHSRRIGRVQGWLAYHDDRVPATIRLNSAARRALSGRSRLDATARLTLRDHGPNRVLDVPVHVRRATMGS